MNYTLIELKEQHPWLYNYLSKMLQMARKQVASARKIAKRRLSYRKSDDLNAFTYNQTGFKIENKKLILSRIDGIRIVLHRQPINTKQVTVSRKRGRWCAIATCDVLCRQYSIIVHNRPVGIDVEITKFAHDSNDHAINNPQFLTKMLKPLERANRRLARRQVGCNNHRKASHTLVLDCMKRSSTTNVGTFCTKRQHTTAAATI